MFPDCQVALLGGSASTSKLCDTSDLDIVIFEDSPAGAYRETFDYAGWTIEAFILTTDTFDSFIAAAAKDALPSLLRMCAEGLILYDNGCASTYQKKAKLALDAGPNEWLPEEVDRARYEITSALLDLIDNQHRAERLFIVGSLIHPLVTFILRTQRKWCGEGKWALRALQSCDAPLSDSLITALEQFYRNDDHTALEQWVRAILKPHGGLLTSGYCEWGGPNE